MVFTYLFSVSPDSHMPLNYTSTFNLIFWLALSLFMFESTVMMIFNYGLSKFMSVVPLNILTSLTSVVNILFNAVGFPFKFIELVKPFSSGLYAFLYAVLCTYAIIVACANTIIKHFTDRTLNI